MHSAEMTVSQGEEGMQKGIWVVGWNRSGRYNFSIGNIKPEVVVDHLQAPPSAFRLEMDGSHFMSIWGSRARTCQCALDSSWQCERL